MYSILTLSSVFTRKWSNDDGRSVTDIIAACCLAASSGRKRNGQVRRISVKVRYDSKTSGFGFKKATGQREPRQQEELRRSRMFQDMAGRTEGLRMVSLSFAGSEKGFAHHELSHIPYSLCLTTFYHYGHGHGHGSILS